MNNPSIADVTLPASDYRRLERLTRVRAHQGDVDARFLLGQVNRAEVVPDRAGRLDSIVTRSEIPIFAAGRTNVVRIESVSRGDPNDVVRALFCNPVVKGKKLFDDDDPGPSVA